VSKVLVTGSDGFIGSHLVELLIREGYEVKAFVMYNSMNSWGWLDSLNNDIKSEIEVVSGDIRDPFVVKNAMQQCDAVCHLAALIGIPYSYIAPQNYVETNVQGTLNVVEAAKELGIAKVIHTSTSEVYGTAQFVPITEEHPLQGQSPYSATKIGADQLAMSYFLSFETPVVILRPFNTYGPRQSARAIIPTVISQIASGSRQIKLGSLHPTRDFSYVLDTAAGFAAALRASGGIGEVINIGSNFEVSMGETVSMIADVMGTKIEVVSDDGRIRPKGSEVERLWADNSKAERLLGWRPDYAGRDGFRRGLQQTVEWFAMPKNLAHYKTDIYNV